MPNVEPWHFECKATKNTIHHWIRTDDGTAECKFCHIKLTVEQTRNCFRGYER